MSTEFIQEPEREAQAELKTERRKTPPSVTTVRPERIRAELNIEKWPAIWNPTHSKIHSKSRAQPRSLERVSAII